MNQPLFVPTILTVKASEDLQKSVAKDLEKTQEISISELLHDKKEEEDNKTEITERN